MTPCVPNVHLKPKFGIEDALRRELHKRGYPPPRAIEALPALRVAGAWWTPEMFAVRRRQGGRARAVSGHPGAFWRLVFERRVRGPLALDFACHLGLGLFRREDDILNRPEPPGPTEAETPPRVRKVADAPRGFS